MKTLKHVYWSIWLPLCFIAVFTSGWITSAYINKPIEETSVFCKDQKYRTAWLAKRDGVYRCFLQWNQWPNRAFGTNIPHEQQNYYSTPFHFIQRELRFDFQEEEFPLP